MLKRAYIYFWLTGVLFLIYYLIYPNGHLNFNDSTQLDFEISKYNSNIRSFTFLIVICLFFGIGTSYWLIEKFKIKLIELFTLIHVYITLGITWFNCVLILYSFRFPNKFKSLLNDSMFESVENIFSLLIIIVQLLFLINVVIGIKNAKSIY